jgi:hypothetical protein
MHTILFWRADDSSRILRTLPPVPLLTLLLNRQQGTAISPMSPTQNNVLLRLCGPCVVCRPETLVASHARVYTLVPSQQWRYGRRAGRYVISSSWQPAIQNCSRSPGEADRFVNSREVMKPPCCYPTSLSSCISTTPLFTLMDTTLLRSP